MVKVIIITGASSGLGREYVRQLDRKDSEAEDEFWLIARRQDRLKNLSNIIRHKIRYFAYDLTDRENIDSFAAILKAEKPVVKMIINAAGFGRIGDYSDITIDDTDKMIDLNCRAAVAMTQTVIPYMVRGSRIVEICSSSAYMPIPYLNVYASSKAFMLSYSRALGKELMPAGIVVTAVCPYWVKNTEFISKAESIGKNSYIKGFPLASDSEAVVSRSLTDIRLGLHVSTPGPVCTLQRIFSRFFSADGLMLIWDLIRKI